MNPFDPLPLAAYGAFSKEKPKPIKAVHRFEAENVEIKIAGKEGLQVELRGEKIDELKYLLSRALNTLDPQKSPKWANWLVDRL